MFALRLRGLGGHEATAASLGEAMEMGCGHSRPLPPPWTTEGKWSATLPREAAWSRSDRATKGDMRPLPLLNWEGN